MKNVQVRFANKDDCSLISSFITELAEYEKMLDHVVATEADILQQFFSEKPCAEALLAFVESQPAGIALFYQNFSTFLCKPGLHIDDLFVKPEYRGEGIGTKLFDALCDIANERDYGRVEWTVLDWNIKAKKFYEAKGAYSVSDQEIYRLDKSALKLGHRAS